MKSRNENIDSQHTLRGVQKNSTQSSYNPSITVVVSWVCEEQAEEKFLKMILSYYLALVFWTPAGTWSSSVHSTLKRWIKEIIQENWIQSHLVLNKLCTFCLLHYLRG